MVFSFRETNNYFSTQLSIAASVTDTTMRAPGFTALGTGYGEKYVPLVLHDDAAGVFEIVWVSAHTTASDTVTVARGKEGSSARPWPSGTRVECAPTAYDMIMMATSGALPSDAQFGQRAYRTDKLDVVMKTFNGWVPAAGVALAGNVGPNMHSATPPDGATILAQMQYVPAFTTNGNGDKTVNFKQPFPTNCLGVMITSVDFAHVGPFVVSAVNASSVTFTTYNGNSTRTTQTNVSCVLFALGW
ncbi:hypothetical protein [Amycolatopsis sp. NPDC049159]|uniref:gp53-like domain-containing protein n=1 Tax=Amycolatopsis sp. NPDC049159 TaxID=3157210 RepID=UPI0033ED48E5